MSCRRCAQCEISYPPATVKCAVCGDSTVFISDGACDTDWRDKVEALNTVDGNAKVRAWRHDVLAGLGFGGVELELLTEADADLHRADELVRAGCPPGLAARILL